MFPGPCLAFFFFFGFSVYILVSIHRIEYIDFIGTHLVPSPDRSETVHEGNVFPEVGVEPQSRRDHKVGDTEENNAEDSHEEEETEETEESPAEIVDSLSQNQGP